MKFLPTSILGIWQAFVPGYSHDGDVNGLTIELEAKTKNKTAIDWSKKCDMQNSLNS